MKREIKFRAWDVKAKYMRDSTCGDLVSFSGAHYSLAEKRYDTPNIEIEKDECILMQYTGLKDKNGRNIFEGDILKSNSGNIHPVDFDKGCFNWNGEPLFYDEGIELNPNEWAEIIGNIYQNPDLLT